MQDVEDTTLPRRLWNGICNSLILLNVAASNSVCSGHNGKVAYRTNSGSVQWALRGGRDDT